ncbi:methionine--tRNA ligase [Myxococcota bacterium]|nr:methionine--tRNA ligase [Myxococcota bacterium]
MSSYVSTAISYVNAPPHLGHAFELVFADALVRGRRARGEEVHFITGSDENSLKNVRAAEEAGVPTHQLVDRHARRFVELAARLDVAHDDFIRTTEARHEALVRRVWEACDLRGDLHRAKYRGLYCVGCEQFYAPDELDGELCPEHARPLEVVEEENVFFRLSRYQHVLESLLESGRLAIIPDGAREDALALVRRGLEDLSVSRSVTRARGWGIPVPGDPTQIVYVWFDALLSYVSALGETGDAPLRRAFWEGASERIHVIGKGITRFHALVWPAILLSAGLPLPTTLVVHGYLTVEGRKIGKSLGNVVDPFALADQHGVEALRYWLLGHVSPFRDGDFRVESLARARDAALADQLGNLLQRTARLVARTTGGERPGPGLEGSSLLDHARTLDPRVARELAAFRPDRALAAIFELVEAANRFVDEQAPWRLLGRADARARLEGVLGATVHALDVVAHALAPFLPSTAAELERRLGRSTGRVLEGPPLFPKSRTSQEVIPPSIH